MKLIILPKRPTILALFAGLLILAGGIFQSGLYTLGENQVAVVVEYEYGELVGDTLDNLANGKLGGFRADLISIIHEEHSGGSTKVIEYEDPSLLPFLTPYGKLYWHLPQPFGKHYTFNLGLHTYHLTVPLMVPTTFDQEDRPLMYLLLTMDLDGNHSTDDPGFQIVSAHDLFDMQFTPGAKLSATLLHVTGSFRITCLEKYALWIKDTYGQMDMRIEQQGFFGEIAEGLYGDKLIEAYLSNILDFYVWQVVYPELFENAQARYPWLTPQALDSILAASMIKDPEILTEGFQVFIESPEFLEMTNIDFEGSMGISILDEIRTRVYAGNL